MTKNKRGLFIEKSSPHCVNCGHDRVWKKPSGVYCTNCGHKVVK